MPVKKQCRLIKIEKLTDDISSFQIDSIDSTFENIEPGSHIDIYLDDDLIRQYSVWDWTEDNYRLSIAVKREESGTGGSKKMHQLKEGDLLEIDGPRNHFKLIDGAPHYTLIAGGIGVTPIYSMVNHLKQINADFSVYYLVQKPEMAAFLLHFENLNLANNFHLHCDNQDGFFDFSAMLNKNPKSSVIYTCGPEPMLNAIFDAVDDATENYDLHYERFKLASDNNNSSDNNSFEVKINSTGEIIQVDAEESILNALKKQDIHVESACAEGLCGPCITDAVLSDDEKASNEYMCVCVSRAKSKLIILDL